MSQLEKWPTLFGLSYEPDTMKNGFIKIVEFLEDNTDFWCMTHSSLPTDFYSLLLNKFTGMPESFAIVIEKTLAMPLSTADTER